MLVLAGSYEGAEGVTEESNASAEHQVVQVEVSWGLDEQEDCDDGKRDTHDDREGEDCGENAERDLHDVLLG